VSGTKSYCSTEKSISKINGILKKNLLSSISSVAWKRGWCFSIILQTKEKYIYFKILGKNNCEKREKLLKFLTPSFVLRTVDCSQMWFNLLMEMDSDSLFLYFSKSSFDLITRSTMCLCLDIVQSLWTLCCLFLLKKTYSAYVKYFM
jgi:hypothetical protein